MRLKSLNIVLLLFIHFTCMQAQVNERVFENTIDKQQNSRSLYGYNKFRNKMPFGVVDSTVTFFIRENKRANRVVLSGSFSNWSTEAIGMQKTDSGWIALVKLAAGK